MQSTSDLATEGGRGTGRDDFNLSPYTAHRRMLRTGLSRSDGLDVAHLILWAISLAGVPNPLGLEQESA